MFYYLSDSEYTLHFPQLPHSNLHNFLEIQVLAGYFRHLLSRDSLVLSVRLSSLTKIIQIARK